MGIGDMMAVIAFFIGVIVAYPALLMLLSILFSKTATKASSRLDRGFRLPFIVGLVVAAIGGVAIVALVSAGSVLQLVGGILFLVLSFWGTIGIAGLSQVIGARLDEMNTGDQSPFTQWLRGGAVLTLSFAFPLLGWFVILPIGTLLGLGAATLSWFTKMPKPDANNPDLALEYGVEDVSWHS